ncbi:hypothetical protein G8S21_10000 [Clostridium botulinum C]|uniref:hypothetical protein n=1 Tax=Clostridium botulinum TaxID=1491 RepID=UPI001E4815A5|nr:hypothetical protein [Clostridium botulinum]MCD3246269.1 hypothetical protein [Clostridium botulinum C]MCD3260705.1 hypothetical protein [Clostridium botulinum C]
MELNYKIKEFRITEEGYLMPLRLFLLWIRRDNDFVMNYYKCRDEVVQCLYNLTERSIQVGG